MSRRVIRQLPFGSEATGRVTVDTECPQCGGTGLVATVHDAPTQTMTIIVYTDIRACACVGCTIAGEMVGRVTPAHPPAAPRAPRPRLDEEDLLTWRTLVSDFMDAMRPRSTPDVPPPPSEPAV